LSEHSWHLVTTPADDAEEWSEDHDAEEWSEDHDAEEWSEDHDAEEWCSLRPAGKPRQQTSLAGGYYEM
jgi:hypothetical protein